MSVKCPKCSANVSESDRFCSHCGHPLELVATNSVDARNGKIEAPIFQAGRDIFYNPEQPESFEDSKALYDAVPKWRSPVTQGVISWVGLVLGLVGVFPLWKVMQPLYYLFSKGSAAQATESGREVWAFCLMVIVLVFCLVMALRRLVKNQLRLPLWWGFALSGVGRRITLEKIRANCPKCGGKMRYYNKETRGLDYVDANGSKRHKVLEREPYLECKRNPKHCFPVDPAEHREE